VTTGVTTETREQKGLVEDEGERERETSGEEENPTKMEEEEEVQGDEGEENLKEVKESEDIGEQQEEDQTEEPNVKDNTDDITETPPEEKEKEILEEDQNISKRALAFPTANKRPSPSATLTPVQLLSPSKPRQVLRLENKRLIPEGMLASPQPPAPNKRQRPDATTRPPQPSPARKKRCRDRATEKRYYATATMLAGLPLFNDSPPEKNPKSPPEKKQRRVKTHSSISTLKSPPDPSLGLNARVTAVAAPNPFLDFSRSASSGKGKKASSILGGNCSQEKGKGMEMLKSFPGQRGDPRRRDCVRWLPEGKDAQVDWMRKNGFVFGGKKE